MWFRCITSSVPIWVMSPLTPHSLPRLLVLFQAQMRIASGASLEEVGLIQAVASTDACFDSTSLLPSPSLFSSLSASFVHRANATSHPPSTFFSTSRSSRAYISIPGLTEQPTQLWLVDCWALNRRRIFTLAELRCSVE